MIKSTKMYFASIEASPQKGTDASSRYGGAQVACWINTDDWVDARKRAIALIERSGWRVVSVQEEKTISSGTYSPGDEGLRYFNQAITDGEVCAIHTYPKENS
jgi:hypothetical protein